MKVDAKVVPRDSERELVRGEREIEPVKPLIVERTFREFAEGKRAACHRTRSQRRCLPARRASMACYEHCGDVRRGTGIIKNELYVGARVWNHKHYATEPGTGTTVTRFNPRIRRDQPNYNITGPGVRGNEEVTIGSA
jgi:hypothetical protein